LPRLAGIDVPAFGYARAGRTGTPQIAVAGAAAITADGTPLRPFTAETPVRIASISKLVVALAIWRLVDAGRLDPDADASLALGIPLRNPRHPGVPVTIRQLLRHESSLVDSGGYGARLGTPLSAMLGPESWGEWAPGQRFDYANLNSVVLATVIERVTGERFDVAARRLVLEPLGLSACFNWSGCTPEAIASGATLYRKSPDGGESWAPQGPWVPQVDAERPAGGCPIRLPEGASCNLAAIVPGENGGLFAPQGGLRISLSDLARLGQALLMNSNGFLKPATHAALFAARPVAPHAGGEETDPGLMQAWSQGGLHCFSGKGATGGDQPTAPAPMPGCGHLGEAYGLFSALVVDPAAGTVHAWLLTGSAAAPPPGTRSRFNALEEALAAAALGSRR
jgi:CubicO group peptidase (beta-lactamase class C family)